MALEEHVSALHKQLAQTELDCVNKKAQIATLARLADGAAAPARMPGSDAAATQGPGDANGASQPQLDPWQISATARPAVRLTVTSTLHELDQHV